jgi:hypothetical protein
MSHQCNHGSAVVLRSDSWFRGDPFNRNSPRNLIVSHNRYGSNYLDNVQPQPNRRVELKHILLLMV